MDKQFNTGYVEIRTLEGDKFIKDLNISDSIQTQNGYCNIVSLEKVRANFTEEVYNIYYDLDGEEKILARVSGDFQLSCKKVVRKLKVGDTILVLNENGSKTFSTIKEIERMEAIGGYFYNLKISGNTFYADGVCLRNFR